MSQESAEVLGPPAGRIARSAGVLVFISALTKPLNFLREAIFSGEMRTLAIDLMLAPLSLAPMVRIVNRFCR